MHTWHAPGYKHENRRKSAPCFHLFNSINSAYHLYEIKPVVLLPSQFPIDAHASKSSGAIISQQTFSLASLSPSWNMTNMSLQVYIHIHIHNNSYQTPEAKRQSVFGCWWCVARCGRAVLFRNNLARNSVLTAYNKPYRLAVPRIFLTLFIRHSHFTAKIVSIVFWYFVAAY